MVGRERGTGDGDDGRVRWPMLMIAHLYVV